MNERIEQLADEAGADIWGDQIMVSRHFDIEKFAELIIRECAVLCRWEHEAHAMLEHFGVSE
jgi:hypothetical protein